jgi:hypothetical protein
MRKKALDVQTSIRFPEGLLERADRLVEALQDDPEWAARGELTRSDILRIALTRGIESLEKSTKRRNL